MNKRDPKNIAASVRARLTDIARNRHEELQTVLTRYAIERFLYRLSVSGHGGDFVLKGAMLFQLWTDLPHRATKDVDLLGTGENSLERVTEVIGEVCSAVVPEDGLTFDSSAVQAERIKEDHEYEGVRVTCPVRLGNARLRLQIDIGFGDAVVPPADQVNFPTLLDFPVPVLKAYPRETVVAEKFQAMTTLGMQNSRMKDFFDLWILCRDFAFDGEPLVRAMTATFLRRRTPSPIETPPALTGEFGTDPNKIKQWEASIGKGKLSTRPAKLEVIISVLESFLMLPSQATATGATFSAVWKPGGPWIINH